MSIDAVFFDLGGVILRTEHQAPREHLAERLGLSYEELVGLVFESRTAKQASVGELSAQEHWKAIAQRLSRPPAEAQQLQDEFFAGDVLDLGLLAFIRGLKRRVKTGLISNAWTDMRAYIRRNKFEDAFDTVVISAEVRTAKPEPGIYRHALRQVGLAAESAVMVDDVEENVAAAKGIGMRGILFRGSAALEKELESILPAPDQNARRLNT